MNVNPGELNKRIEILRVDKTDDSEGYYTETHTVLHSCFAKFSRTSATEKYTANADMTRVEARFLIRAPKAEINRKMLVKYKNQLYQIEYVNDYSDEQEYVEIWATLQTLEANI